MAYKLWSFIAALAIGICMIPHSVKAGGSPMIVERPAPVHRFFDSKNLGLQSLCILAMAADFASTRRALQIPGTTEMNPVATSPGSMLALKIAGAGAGLGLAYMMHRTGHHKAERVIPVIFGAPSAAAAVHNVGIHR